VNARVYPPGVEVETVLGVTLSVPFGPFGSATIVSVADWLIEFGPTVAVTVNGVDPGAAAVVVVTVSVAVLAV
jgi:hypothetical protein